ncbi:MAG: type II secretion system F family protein [Bdellovibrionota bacterium]|nr:type II secretion system F family protein [Pseudomonadota bacterium]MDY6090619.1 type II secretion system F family protein [Bdellovibrionota bacterium]
MPIFLWEGKDSRGQTISGELEATDKIAVFNLLKARKITANTNKIREKGAGMNKEIKIPFLGAKIKQKDISIFTRQFSTMIDAGLPLVQGLSILSKQNPNPKMKAMLESIKEEVESGKTLTESLKNFPKHFDTLYVNMVDAGENGGILDIILDRLSVYMEKSIKLKREIKTALIYPSVVISAAILVTTILLVFVIPTFAELFEDFGAELPLPTQIVINISNFFVKYFFVISGSFFTSLIIFFKFSKTDKGKSVLHPIYLKLPIFGDLIRKVAVARFTRTLGTMLSSGVPILTALNICSKTAGNKVVEVTVQKTRLAISEGKQMADTLSESNVFPPMVTQMIGVGETSGALDKMLEKVAIFYEEEVDNAVGALKQLIEPLMILFLGVIIGGLVIAMYLPIFKLGAVTG